MHIDHDHEFDVARGLLCRDCNLILGLAQEDPRRLEAILDYLAEWGKL